MASDEHSDQRKQNLTDLPTKKPMLSSKQPPVDFKCDRCKRSAQTTESGDFWCVWCQDWASSEKRQQVLVSSPRAVAEKWEAYVGSFLGGFRVGKERAVQLVKPASVGLLRGGGLELSARYDPPGSGWLALVASIITVILVFALAQTLGFMGGPGWLLWYILIVAMRRREVTFNLLDAESVVVDEKNRRFAFRSKFDQVPCWFAIEIRTRFDELQSRVNTSFQGKVTDGDVTRPSMTVVIVLLLFLVLLFSLMAWGFITSIH
ncbi:MAG: hypothetical protein NTY19_06745 [Planctomycetota bacterium]|nr:hypothetical protein [Planctomycetota bacterium]